MQTSLMTSISDSFKPWAALARDLADSHLEHARSAGQLFASGLDKTSVDQFTNIAGKIGSDGLTASVKALRLAMRQSAGAVKSVKAQAPTSANSIPGADLLQNMQTQFASAQEQFVGFIEKAAEMAALVTADHKATRA